MDTKSKSYKSSSLPPVQRQTLEYLRNYMAHNGSVPSLKEISQHIGAKSSSTAHFHLERLEAKGFISRGEDGQLEIIEVERPEFSPTSVPLVGVIAAGVPVEAIEQEGAMIDVPPLMLDSRGEVYCLKVSGDSMIDAHICDGDTVVVRKQSIADDNSIVVAVLEDGTATLKRFRRLGASKFMLIPANQNLSPVVVEELEIRGQVIGIMRDLRSN